MADIIVNTDKLRTYADQLGKINKRIVTLDWRIKSLYAQVGLFDLISLTKADSLVNFNFRLLGSQQYLTTTAALFEGTETKLLKQDPTNFNKPAISGWQEAVWDVGHAVKTGCEKIKSKVVQTVDYLVDSYYSYGWVYNAVQYGKAALKAAKGVGKIISGVGSIFGTGGLSTPVAILTIISGANDVYNSIMDATYVATDQYDLVGKTDGLKDLLAENGEWIGENLLGNAELGKNIGLVTYYGIDVVTSLASIEDSWGKYKEAGKINISELKGESSGFFKEDITDVIGSIGKEAQKANFAKLASNYPQYTNLIKKGHYAYNILDKTYNIGDKISEGFADALDVDDYKTPLMDAVDPVRDGIKTGGKVINFTAAGFRYASKVTNYIFG